MAIDPETITLVLHGGTLLVLYLFVLGIAWLVWRDVARGPAQPAAPAARLVVLDSGNTGLATGQRLSVLAFTTLGRSSENTIVLSEASVSAVHAAISWRAGHWWLQDQDSRNGTLLNDAVIEKATLLCHGDVIAIGLVRLRFEA
ncbi:MAG: FHA domain-containing protein [Chloroflexi bacterium]|nr:FHA domain-containing protein [Chloroflexota bacterium]MBU1751853.1 FHA domain-containing protein [Chloroflexota bacterium]